MILDSLPGLNLAPQTVYAIGRNYSEHAKELGNPIPEEPVVFLKPRSCLVGTGSHIRIPEGCARLDPEVELVVALEKGGIFQSRDEAFHAIAGVAVGIDFTARDLQAQLKAKGLPWTLAKGRPGFAPVSAFLPRKAVSSFEGLSFGLEVNGELRQKGKSAEMLVPLVELVVFLSQRFDLLPGDVIFTGTPAGVKPLQSGDRLRAFLESPELELRVSIL